MKAVISGNSRIVVAPGQVHHRVIDDEVVILNTESGVYYGLTGGGTRVWELLQEPCAANQVKDALISEYDVDPERCEEDVLALLQQMADAGHIKLDNESAP